MAEGVSRLVVNPVACDGVGLCAHLAPDEITLDSWGYPIVRGPVSGAGLRAAQKAARACPKAALTVEPGR